MTTTQNIIVPFYNENTNRRIIENRRISQEQLDVERNNSNEYLVGITGQNYLMVRMKKCSLLWDL